MTEKNEKPVEPKPTTEAKSGTVKPAETQSTLPEQQKEEQPSSSSNQGAVAGNLSPELTELVTELRETVKRIDPRRHTAKTLRRPLSNVSDILADIEKLYTQE